MSIYTLGPVCTCIAETWKNKEKAFFIIKSGWLIHYLHYIGVLVLVFPLAIYYSIILMAALAFFSRKTHTPYREMSKMKKSAKNCICVHINLLKMSCRKHWKWHFWDPKVKNFLGEHALGWATLAATFLPCMHTHSKSHATPLKRLIILDTN